MGAQPENKTYGTIGSFESPGELLHASEVLRDAGYTRFETFTPFPVHGIEKAMGLKPTHLPWIVLIMGSTGLMIGIILQAFANGLEFDWYLTGFSYLISGKDQIYAPTMVPVAFEVTVLLSAFGAIFGMFALNRLPMFYHPTFKHQLFERVTDDRFFICIEAMDTRYNSELAREILEKVGAEHIEELTE
jgi:hypothetical protein